MSTLQIDTALLRGLYRTADADSKSFLENKYGSELFSQKITDRIKTWEDAAAERGLDPIESLPFKNPANSYQEAANAFFKLDIIATVLLEGVVLDWTNSKQKKWYAWFNDYTPGSGFRFGDSVCAWTLTLASGGARLCLDTEEKARYFGTQFLSIFNQFLNPIK